MLTKNILSGIVNAGRDIDEKNEKIFIIDTSDNLIMLNVSKNPTKFDMMLIYNVSHEMCDDDLLDYNPT